MPSQICHGCGNDLLGWDREQLPLCVRCRADINAILDPGQRALIITQIRQAVCQHSQASSLISIKASLKAIADRFDEHAWEIGEEELEGD